MREYYPDNWLKEAKNILKNQQGLEDVKNFIQSHLIP
jgi:hypothetical protein